MGGEKGGPAKNCPIWARKGDLGPISVVQQQLRDPSRAIRSQFGRMGDKAAVAAYISAQSCSRKVNFWPQVQSKIEGRAGSPQPHDRAPGAVTTRAAAARPARSAGSGPSPQSRRARKVPVKASPAPVVSATSTRSAGLCKSSVPGPETKHHPRRASMPPPGSAGADRPGPLPARAFPSRRVLPRGWRSTTRCRSVHERKASAPTAASGPAEQGSTERVIPAAAASSRASSPTGRVASSSSS